MRLAYKDEAKMAMALFNALPKLDPEEGDKEAVTIICLVIENLLDAVYERDEYLHMLIAQWPSQNHVASAQLINSMNKLDRYEDRVSMDVLGNAIMILNS